MERLLLIVVLFVVLGLLVRRWRSRVYRHAKDEIFNFVKSYKRRCTGNNRFVITVTTLQDSFREYDIELIEKVWQELINERIVQQDSLDNEWCIR